MLRIRGAQLPVSAVESSPAGSFVVFINIRILERRLANYGKHFRVAGLRHLHAKPITCSTRNSQWSP